MSSDKSNINQFNLGTLVYYFDILKSGTILANLEERIEEKYMQSGVRFENQLEQGKLNEIIQRLDEGRYEFRITLSDDNACKVKLINSE